MEAHINIYKYCGEGLEKSYVNTDWLIGIKNYKPASSSAQMDCLERHLLTDELFIPLTEGNRIVISDGEGQCLQSQSMLVGRIYCVPKGVWHNVLMPENGKLALVERPETSMENSETFFLSESQKTQLRQF